MKAIIINIKPKWCVLMMNGDKTVEVKTSKALYKAIQKLIDENGYADIYVYYAKGKERLVDLRDDSFYYGMSKRLNGKVPFKFRCYKVEEIRLGENQKAPDYSDLCFETKTLNGYQLETKSCLDFDNLKTYLQCKIGYAIHISNLEIFDKPKELSEFQGTCKGCEAFRLKVCKLNFEQCDKHLTKAPQSWCYVEVE